MQRVANRKPVVAYIRGVGASGAYLLSCPAAKIISLPSALVGSIGVLYVRPALQNLLERFGIGLSVYKGGRFEGHDRDSGVAQQRRRTKSLSLSLRKYTSPSFAV